jgi:hypothetical protein
VSATRGLIAGTLMLTAGQAVLASSDTKAGGGAVGALFTIAASVLNRLMNPAVPLIPELRTADELAQRNKQGSSSSGSSSSAHAHPADYRTPALPAVAAPTQST